MLGIVVALKKELAYVLDLLTLNKQFTIAGKKVYCGKLFGKDTVIIESGIGKVNAALSTQIIIDKFCPKYLINFGSCGGIKDKVKPLNYYLVEKCCQYDFDLSKLDDVPVGYIQDYDKVFFETASLHIDGLEKVVLSSSDRFTTSEDESVIASLNSSVFDMEGGAIGEVAEANCIPFVIVKGVTDVIGSNISPQTYYSNLETVCKGFPKILKILFEKLD